MAPAAMSKTIMPPFPCRQFRYTVVTRQPLTNAFQMPMAVPNNALSPIMTGMDAEMGMA